MRSAPLPADGSTAKEAALDAKARTSEGGAPPVRQAVIRSVLVGGPLVAVAWLGPLRAAHPIALALQLTVLFLVVAWWAELTLGRAAPARTPIDAPLLAYVAAAVVATAFSVDPRISLDRTLWLAALVFIYFFIGQRMRSGWGSGPFVFALLAVGALFIAQALAAIVDWHLGWLEVRTPVYPLLLRSYRLGGVAENPNFLAGLLALLLPFLIVRLIGARSAWGKAWWAVYLAALVVVLFYTRSRGGWLASAVGVTACLGWLVYRRAGLPRLGGLGAWWRRSRSLWLPAAAYVALFAALYLLTWAMTPPSGRLTRGEFTSGRTLRWEIALDQFAERPLVGSGPGTFSRLFTDLAPDTHANVSMHAHNLALDELMQAGLLGGLALAAALTITLVVCVRGLLRCRSGDARAPGMDEATLIAATAALGGWLAHCLVDVTTWLPVIAISVTAVVAMAMHASGAIRRGGTLPRWAALALMVPLALVPLLVRHNQGRVALQEAFVAGLGDRWVEAAAATDRALAADPGLGLHWGQSAFAWAMAADQTDDDALLDLARERYLEALEREPAYVPNYLNAALLLDEAGESDRAGALLEEAAQHARTWALPHLLLGEHRAARGDTAGATEAFWTAFDAEIHASEMVACVRSDACRQASLAYQDPDADLPSYQAERQARRLLADGRPEEALAQLDGLSLGEVTGWTWMARARAHALVGDLALARYEAHAVTALGLPGRQATAPDAALALAALHLAEGSPEEAVAVLETAVLPDASQTSATYAYRVYGRLPLPGLLLPRLELLQQTASHLAVYRELEDLYAEAARDEDASWARGRADMLESALGG